MQGEQTSLTKSVLLICPGWQKAEKFSHFSLRQSPQPHWGKGGGATEGSQSHLFLSNARSPQREEITASPFQQTELWGGPKEMEGGNVLCKVKTAAPT